MLLCTESGKYHHSSQQTEDAMMILKLFDAIFREDKQIKAGFTNPDDIRREQQIRRIAKYRKKIIMSPFEKIRALSN